MTELHTESEQEDSVLGQDPTQEVVENVIEQDASGTGDTGSDLATEQGEDKPKDVNQDAVQNAINKQHAKYREEERKRKALEKELKELRSKQPKEPDAPQVPDAPDPYDKNYEQLIKARDQKLLERAKYDAKIEAKQADEQKLATEKQELRQKEIGKLVENYDNKTKQLGLSVDDIHKAGQAIVDYGINNELAEFILGDDDGPLLTQYLASNPAELDDLRSLPIASAAIRIHTNIREKVQGLKPKSTSAPDPAPLLSGNGSSEGTSGIIKGAVFE